MSWSNFLFDLIKLCPVQGLDQNLIQSLDLFKTGFHHVTEIEEDNWLIR
jgi:hypothetical protein